MNDLLLKINQLDMRIKIAGLAIILILVFCLDFFFLLRPQFNHYVKLGSNIQEVKDKITTGSQILEKAQFLRMEVEDMRRSIALLQDQVTAKDAIPVVLERVAALASEGRFNVGRMTPEMGNQKIVHERSGKQYYTLPIILSGKASFHDLGRFINRIENDSLFMRVNRFDIAAGNDGRHTVNMTVIALLLDGDMAVIKEEIAKAKQPVQPQEELVADPNRQVFSDAFPGVPSEAMDNMMVYDSKPIKGVDNTEPVVPGRPIVTDQQFPGVPASALKNMKVLDSNPVGQNAKASKDEQKGSEGNQILDKKPE